MRARLLGLLLVCCLGAVVWAEPGPVAHWNFDEGKGDVLHDRSGNNNHGKIHGAKWVRFGKGYALKFGRSGGYVDCGDNPRLKTPGDMTIAAWVKLTASPFPDGTTNWYIVDCEKYQKSGFMVRIDGASCRLTYRDNSGFTLSKTKLKNHVLYHLAVVKRGTRVTSFVDGSYDAHSAVRQPTRGTANFTISNQSQSFNGIIDDLKMYDRALSQDEIVAEYKKGAASRGKDVSWFGKLKVKPYFHFAESKAILEVDFKGVLPLREGSDVLVQLGRPRQKPLEVRPVTSIPETGRGEFAFALGKLPAGQYELRVLVKEGGRIRVEEEVPFHYPPLPVAVASPGKKVVPSLPPPPEPVRYELELSKAGGFSLRFNDERFKVESSYSYPHGGENTLSVSATPGATCEPHWKVTTAKRDAATYRINAGGRYYAIERTLSLEPHRILVRDRIVNTSDGDLGIILSNHVNIKRDKVLQYRKTRNPSIFLHKENLGLGMVALDDVYQVQYEAYCADGYAGLRTSKFGLAKGASYTLEWAIYPNRSGDYYDFITAVRKDEGLIRTVEGSFAFFPGDAFSRLPSGRRTPATKAWAEPRGLKYAAIGCLTMPADEPGNSLEGIEFTEYPKECALLKKTFAKSKENVPGLKVMFHIAHSIYSTNKPDRFFDSRLIQRNGKHEPYSPSPSSVSKEIWDAGYRWYIYYPTLENSFGRALLEATDFMLDELGVTGIFADGLIDGYGGSYTYDRWDGHSVEIDPATKTISKKMGSIKLLGMDALIAMVRKIHAKGGVVIANSGPPTRRFAKENVIYCIETETADYRVAVLHLAPTVIALGARARTTINDRETYLDMREKLKWGALYFFYAEKPPSHKWMTAEMFPITVEEIHSGFIKGRERLITLHSGVYGWPQNRDIHFVYLYDGLGVMVPNHFLTTVDRSGVRTEIALGENETAIVKKIPITFESRRPVNLVAVRYDANAVELILNGSGTVNLQVRSGDFAAKPGAAYIVKTDTAKRVIADERGRLCFKIRLKGQLRLRIEPAEEQ